MKVISSSDLRSRTTDVLREVERGESFVVTVEGAPAAVLSPLSSRRRDFLAKDECVALVSRHQTDSALTADLSALTGEMTMDDAASPWGS